MNHENYKCTLIANASISDAIKAINNVKGWWTENIEGSSEKCNDIFTVSFSETFVTFKISESIPNKKIVWDVIDCNLHWLKDKLEWKGTKIIWELKLLNNNTKIEFTHVGLVPAAECFNDCRKGWDQYLKDSLHKLIKEGIGVPDKKSKKIAS